MEACGSGALWRLVGEVNPVVVPRADGLEEGAASAVRGDEAGVMEALLGPIEAKEGG
jgi:hypothetical protein